MDIRYERNLIKSLDDWNMVAYLFQRYRNIYPEIKYMVELLGTARFSTYRGSLKITPHDEKIARIVLEGGPKFPEVPFSLTFDFVETKIGFPEALKAFGQCEIDFNPDEMATHFNFTKLKAIQIRKISFIKPGKLTPDAKGNFTFIDPETYRRSEIAHNDLRFSTCVFFFRTLPNF